MPMKSHVTHNSLQLVTLPQRRIYDVYSDTLLLFVKMQLDAIPMYLMTKDSHIYNGSATHT